jgi:uncharacterized protein
MNTFVELTLIALSRSRSAENSFVMVLEDESGLHRIPIVIGAAEAQYIGIVLEKLQTKRPMTHDLMLAAIQALGGSIQYVLLHTLTEGVFIAAVHIKDSQGQMHALDARASDAVAIAIAKQVSIFAEPSLPAEAALQSDIFSSESSKTLYSDYTLQDLEVLLKKVLEKEDYESAARIRETIKKKLNNP